MARAAQVAHRQEAEPYVPRIWRLLEEARLKAARDLLAEALGENDREPGLADLSRLLAPPRQRASPLKDRDRSAEFRWIEEHGGEHMGEWVAVLGDALLAHAATLHELLAQLSRVDRDNQALVHHLV